MVTSFQESNLTGPSRTHPEQELSRLLTAAVISPQFRRLLLSNPAQAIASGFGGEAFHLQGEEQQQLAAIQASDLADFAMQVSTLRIFSVDPQR
jgi:hypothetical protein